MVSRVERLETTLDEVDAMVVVIGPGWRGAEDERRRPRLEDPEDYVRREVEAALNRGIPTIPVLVRDAVMSRVFLPEALKPLGRVQAVELSDGRWRADIDELEEVLSNAVRPWRSRRRCCDAKEGEDLALLLIQAEPRLCESEESGFALYHVGRTAAQTIYSLDSSISTVTDPSVPGVTSATSTSRPPMRTVRATSPSPATTSSMVEPR
jgi:hypothetical protein